jgi:hypothetical protein
MASLGSPGNYKPALVGTKGRLRNETPMRLDHDDFGSNRSKIMNVIDSNILRSGMRAENRYTLFLILL